MGNPVGNRGFKVGGGGGPREQIVKKNQKSGKIEKNCPDFFLLKMDNSTLGNLN